MDGLLLSPELTRPPDSSLAFFDTEQPFELDPDLFRRNLDALRETDAALAALVESHAPESVWRPVRGLDGFPTYRRGLGASDDGKAWRCGTAAPRTRAEATLWGYAWKGSNPALAEVGTGAELAELLRRLPAYGAIYVFLEDPHAAVMVLRSLDLAVEILTGRCVLVPPDEPAQFLRGLLSVNPGLLPPGHLIRTFGTAAGRLNQVRGLCERIAHDTSRRRADRLAVLTASARPIDLITTKLRRLAIVDFAGTAQWCDVLRGLASAGAESGIEIRVLAVDSPRAAHPLIHLEHLAAFAPDLTLLVDGSAAAWLRQIPGLACHWLLSAENPIDVADDRPMFAASPAVRDALLSSGVPEPRIIDCFWATDYECDAAEAEWPRDSLQAAGVCLMGTAVDARPERYGIDQPMHRQLWERARGVITSHWETPAGTDPERALALAEKYLGMTLGDADVRGLFLRAIGCALIPATVAERISRTLEADGTRVVNFQEGELRWQPQSTQDSGLISSPAVATPRDGLTGRPLAIVVPWQRDPLSVELIGAGRRGWPILMFAHDAREAERALGGVLKPGSHLTLFNSSKTLRTALGRIRAGDAAVAERAARAQEHLRAEHTWAHRLDSLEIAMKRILAPRCEPVERP